MPGEENAGSRGRSLPAALIGREFQRVTLRLRTGSAMHASQIACLRYFPNCDVGPLVKIDLDGVRFHALIETLRSCARSDLSLSDADFDIESAQIMAVTKVIAPSGSSFALQWHEEISAVTPDSPTTTRQERRPGRSRRWVRTTA